jgi:hypothetical protein
LHRSKNPDVEAFFARKVRPGGPRQRRIARLLERLEAAGAAWAKAEYTEGIETGRIGAVSVRARARRDKAEAAFKDLVARLGHATLGRGSNVAS